MREGPLHLFLFQLNRPRTSHWVRFFKPTEPADFGFVAQKRLFFAFCSPNTLAQTSLRRLVVPEVEWLGRLWPLIRRTHLDINADHSEPRRPVPDRANLGGR